MNIALSYIDYHLATLEQRELFSFTKTQLAALLEKLAAQDGVRGAVLLSTCNRTEVYLSLTDSAAAAPFHTLCRCMGQPVTPFEEHFQSLYGQDAVRHLCELACGIHSQIWGEDQILAQVKDALTLAREQNVTDSVLEVLFRTAVSAAKKVKTTVDFKTGDDSTAKRAVNVLLEQPAVRTALVIGNGAIGRLTAELLVQNGIAVTMTLRQYKHGENSIPAGVQTVNYDQRYAALAQCDAVVSATLSPHHTLHYDELVKLSTYPSVFIDLAVPRDIDPRIEQLDGVTYYNLDDISRDSVARCKAAQLQQINAVLGKYIEDFYKWYAYKTGKRHAPEKKTDDAVSADATDSLPVPSEANADEETGKPSAVCPETTGQPVRAHFPLFVPSEGKTVVVFGGGAIASRRVQTLLPFRFSVTVVSPTLTDDLRTLEQAHAITWIDDVYAPSYVNHPFLVLACTNDRQVNRAIGEYAKAQGIFVSVADCKEECTVFFPAVVLEDEVTVGLVGSGENHAATKHAADTIRAALQKEVPPCS